MQPEAKGGTPRGREPLEIYWAELLWIHVEKVPAAVQLVFANGLPGPACANVSRPDACELEVAGARGLLTSLQGVDERGRGDLLLRCQSGPAVARCLS